MRKITNEELHRPSAEEFAAMPKLPLVVVLDNVRSAQNVGSFFRTGDAFASVITGCMLNGDSLPEALDRAVHFINMGIKATFGYAHNPLDGMNQEKVLHYLNEPLPYYKYELVETIEN